MVSHHNRSRKGITLMEVVISSVIASLLVVPTLTLFATISKSYGSQARKSIASSVAQDLLAEIAQLDYEDTGLTPTFGLESGETMRVDFDDVDDYESWISDPPTRRDGTIVSGADGMITEVSVTRVLPDTPNEDEGVETGLKRIAVRVSGSGLARPMIVYALRAKNGAYDVAPTIKSSIHKVELEILQGSQSISSGVNVTNRIPGQQP